MSQQKEKLVEMTQKEIDLYILKETKRVLQEKTRRYRGYRSYKSSLNTRSQIRLEIKKEKLKRKELKNAKKLLTKVIEQTNYKKYKQDIIDYYEPLLSELRSIGKLRSRGKLLTSEQYIKHKNLLKKGVNIVPGTELLVFYFMFLGNEYKFFTVHAEEPENEIYTVKYFNGNLQKSIDRETMNSLIETEVDKILKTRFSQLIQANEYLKQVLRDCNDIIDEYKQEYHEYIEDNNIKKLLKNESKQIGEELLQEISFRDIGQYASTAFHNFISTAIDNLKYSFKKLRSGQDIYVVIRAFESAKKIQLNSLKLKYEKPLMMVNEKIKISDEKISSLKKQLDTYGKNK